MLEVGWFGLAFGFVAVEGSPRESYRGCLPETTVDFRKLEHGRRMVYAGCAFCLGFGIEGYVVMLQPSGACSKKTVSVLLSVFESCLETGAEDLRPLCINVGVGMPSSWRLHPSQDPPRATSVTVCDVCSSLGVSGPKGHCNLQLSESGGTSEA